METTPCKGHGGNCKNNAQFDGLCYFCHTKPWGHLLSECSHGGCTDCKDRPEYDYAPDRYRSPADVRNDRLGSGPIAAARETTP